MKGNGQKRMEEMVCPLCCHSFSLLE